MIFFGQILGLAVAEVGGGAAGATLVFLVQPSALHVALSAAQVVAVKKHFSKSGGGRNQAS